MRIKPICTMAGRLAPVVAFCLVVFACSDEPVAPSSGLRLPPADFRAQSDVGPPEEHKFGDDTYKIGEHTGSGITEPGLECVESSNSRARICNGFFRSAVDGALLDVNVMVPIGGGPFPLVAIVHGYGGSKNSSGDQANSLLAEGYGVLRWSTRGFGKSWGQVNVVDLHAEVADMRSILSQAVDHRGLRLNPDAVAITGASYGGGHSWLALLAPSFTTPRGQTVRIRTVVPVVGWSDLLYSLVPNGRPRESVAHPGGLKLSFVNGLYLSGVRDDPERPYFNYPEYLQAWHLWLNGVTGEPSDTDPVYQSIEDGLAGYRSIWWRTKDFWDNVLANRVPIFAIQGFTDDLFPLAEAKRMLLALKHLDATYPIEAYFGDLGHPRAANKTGEVDHVLGRISDWLGYHLKGVSPAPTYQIHAAITRPAAQPFSSTDVITVSTWDQLSSNTVVREFDGSTVLVNPASDPLGGFFWDPFVMLGASELSPYTDAAPPTPEPSTSLAQYDVPVSDLSNGASLLIAGEPTVRLIATETTFSHRVQLNVRLIDIAPDGKKTLITRGTYTLDSGSPLTPLGTVDVTIPTYGNVWSAASTHTLRLQISNVDSPYITPSKVPSATQITGVSLTLPVR